MAHGIYKIKVVRVSNGEELYTYTGCAHPQVGERLYIEGKPFSISAINHHVKSGRDGGGTYYGLDYVEVMVAK